MNSRRKNSSGDRRTRYTRNAIRSSLLSPDAAEALFQNHGYGNLQSLGKLTVELFIFIIMIWTMCWTT